MHMHHTLDNFALARPLVPVTTGGWGNAEVASGLTMAILHSVMKSIRGVATASSMACHATLRTETS